MEQILHFKKLRTQTVKKVCELHTKRQQKSIENKGRRFKKMKVNEIMTANPACCTPDTNLQEVAKMMVDNDCGAIPVCEDANHKRPIGIVTDRDITVGTVAKGDNPLEMTAKSVMTKNVVTVTPDTNVEDCLNLMEEKHVRRVPVVGENGECVGIVAQADVATNTSDRKTAEVVEKISQASANN